MADRAFEEYPVKRLRIYLSVEGNGGDDAFRASEKLAGQIEEALEVQGSAIIPMDGRWNGVTEPGFIIEVNYPKSNHPMQLTRENRLRGVLEKATKVTGLTFFVTVENAITAYEVF